MQQCSGVAKPITGHGATAAAAVADWQNRILEEVEGINSAARWTIVDSHVDDITGLQPGFAVVIVNGNMDGYPQDENDPRDTQMLPSVSGSGQVGFTATSTIGGVGVKVKIFYWQMIGGYLPNY